MANGDDRKLIPDGSEGRALSASIYGDCLEEGEESLMIGLIRALGAVALFVAMGLVNLAYADTFSPAAASAGGTVTLSGQARPNSSMSGYFSCSSGCGKTHIGVAAVNAQGWYSLTFKMPLGAKPGGAFVDIGCDNCGNNWRRVTGLQVQASYRVPDFRPVPPQPSPAPTPVTSRQDIITSYHYAFGRDPQEGEILFWQKQVKLSVDQLVTNHRNYIKQNEGVRREIAMLAFKQAYGSSPAPNSGIFVGTLAEMKDFIYGEMVSFLSSKIQPSPAPTPPSNGLSASSQQRVLQVSQQLRTNGTNLLAVRNQVINSLGANNAQKIVPIIETISNNYIAIGNKANGSITSETKTAMIAGLNTQRNELVAKKEQAELVFLENKQIIDAQQPAINKQVELQHFWESDRDNHARNSDDLAKKCQQLDAGACVNWPLEATAIEGAKAKIALAVTQIAVLQAAVAPNHINKAIAQVPIDLVYAPQIRWIDSQIADLQ